MKKCIAVLLVTALVGGFSGNVFAGKKTVAAPVKAPIKKSVNKPQALGLFDIYEQNRQEKTPNYITVDLLLLSYSMIRRQDTIVVEQKVVLPAFKQLVTRLSGDLQKMKDPAAMANRDFMAIITALLTGSDKVVKPANAKRAADELALIMAAEGLKTSPLWNYKIDYSQFIPRGAYTDTPERKNYFRAMRYASAVLFAVKESNSTSIDVKLADRLTGQAMQIATLLAKDKEALALYTRINKVLGFRFGGADDLILADLNQITPKKDQKMADVRKLLQKRAEEVNRQPRILGAVIDRAKLEKGVTPAEALTGFRFFPQRYTSDSAFFQIMVSPQSGLYTGDTQKQPFGLAVINGRPVKGFPTAYELMAQMGSKAAANMVQKNGGQDFSGYGAVMQDARVELAEATGLDRLQNQLFQTLLVSHSDDPVRLETTLAAWTWQRYVSLLYTKQSMTMIVKGMAMSPDRPGATIEPALSVYLALERISEKFAAIDQETGLESWSRFAGILDRLATIASKTIIGVPLDTADNGYLNELDKQLLVMTGGRDKPIVVDVHTEPNSGQVVEEGVGLPVRVQDHKAVGARMSHYEFKYPLKSRLTDQEWQKLVLGKKIPPRK